MSTSTTSDSRRDFALLWGGQAVSSLGTRAANPALTLLVLALTGSPGYAGLVASVALLAFVAAQLPAGWLADRTDRRRLLIGCDIGSAVAALSVAGAVVAGAASVPHVLVAVVVLGAAAAVRITAELAALPHLVADRDLPRALSANQARIYGSGLAGPPLGGLLYAVSRALPFLVDAVSFLVAALCSALIRSRLGGAGAATDQVSAGDAEPTGGGRGRTWSPLAEIWAGLRMFWRHRFVRTTALLVAASDFVINSLILVVVVAALGRGAGAATVGLVLAAGGAGGLLGAVAASTARRLTRDAGPLLVGAPLLTAGATLLLTAPDLAVVGVGYAAVFVAWPAWNAVVTAHWLRGVDDAYRGRVQSAARLVATVPTVAAPAVAGALLSTIGTTATCVSLAVALVVIAFASAAVVRRGAS
jgi:MFS family permease